MGHRLTGEILQFQASLLHYQGEQLLAPFLVEDDAMLKRTIIGYNFIQEYVATTQKIDPSCSITNGCICNAFTTMNCKTVKVLVNLIKSPGRETFAELKVRRAGITVAPQSHVNI